MRVCFLPYLTARRDDDALFARGLAVPLRRHPRRRDPSPSIDSLRWIGTEQSISDPLAGRLDWDGECDP